VGLRERLIQEGRKKSQIIGRGVQTGEHQRREKNTSSAIEISSGFLKRKDQPHHEKCVDNRKV